MNAPGRAVGMIGARELLAAALGAAERGWRVFPLQPGGKRPALKGWPDKASADPVKIGGWWSNGRPHNVGVVTGSPSGIFVLDIDGPEGRASLEALEAEHGGLPATVVAITGRGQHRYFKVPHGREIGSRTGVRPGLDIKGTGGYIVVPPSRHPSGTFYRWEPGNDPTTVGEPAEPPRWLLDMLDAPKSRAGSNGNPRNEPKEASRPADFEPVWKGCGFVQWACDNQPDVGEPQWYFLLSVVARCAFDARDGRALCHEVSAGHPGYSRGETDKKIDHALRGAGPARCETVEQATNGRFCASCEHRGKVRSPIVLGRPRSKKTDDETPPRKTQATRLVELAESAELFHDAESKAFASVQVDGHSETMPLRSKGFRAWLARRYYQEEKRAPGSQGLQDAIGTLEGKALYEGPEQEVFVRLAEHDGAIFLDLANEARQVVRVSAEGWSVLDDCPVKFLRPKGVLDLPVPERGGDLESLFYFLNVEAPEDRILVLSWLIAAFRPRGPYPVLIITGEQGSAKSTACRILRDLLDPNGAPLRSPPRELRDLAVTSSKSWCVCLENLSRLPEWLSDALCRLSTGGGFATRCVGKGHMSGQHAAW